VAPRVAHCLEPIAIARRGQIRREVGREEPGHPGLIAKQLFERLLREHVQESVVLGLRARGVRPIGKQCPHPEDVAAIAHVDEHGLPVELPADGYFALHHYVELGLGGVAFLENDLVDLQVPNANPAREAVEELRRKPIERRVPGQAVGNGENHGIRGHARYLSKARSTISATSFEIPGTDAMRSSSAFINVLRPGS